MIVLRDYFPDLEINSNARFYSHKYGKVRPHKDGNHDNICNYTLLLYLNDDFKDGKLSIKMKRRLEEIDDEKKHKVFTLKPIKGYGVIFNKDCFTRSAFRADLLHWAEEIWEGNKDFLLIHLFSKF
jgi:hypothetical protein